jgi:prepilin-type N-terminal cleavage/methylation domain-containing protein
MHQPENLAESSAAKVRVATDCGFSMIELVASLAILLALAALLFPVLARAKRKPGDAVCLNHLHQLYVAITLYQQDNRTRFPLSLQVKGHPGVPPGPNTPPRDIQSTEFALGGTSALWNTAVPVTERPLAPYIKTTATFRCPFDTGGDLGSQGGPNVTPSFFQFFGSSYRYNGGGVAGRLAERYLSGQPENWLQQPSRFVILSEPPAQPFKFTQAEPICFYWHGSKRPGWAIGMLDSERGPRYAPILFGDGHIRLVNFTDYYSTTPEAGGCVWNQ